MNNSKQLWYSIGAAALGYYVGKIGFFKSIVLGLGVLLALTKYKTRATQIAQGVLGVL